jgi:hypothetical protein
MVFEIIILSKVRQTEREREDMIVTVGLSEETLGKQERKKNDRE